MEPLMNEVISAQPTVGRAWGAMVASCMAVWSLSVDAIAAEVGSGPPLQNRSIAYVMTSYHWALHTTEKAAECPKGMNDGPRDHYAKLFPPDGTKRNVVDTAIKREAETWFPSLEPEPFEFKSPVSKIAPGMNLDGRVDEDDFTSPDGETGIDNQFYRAFGCVADVRPGGSIYFFQTAFMRKYDYARTVIELTEVDSLVNDDEVIVTTYRGLDPMLADATGEAYLPHGTQRVDERWGKKFVNRMRGRIADGVLTTEPADIVKPYTYNYYPRQHFRIRDSRLRLSLLPDSAQGMIAGYLDIWSWYRAFNGALSTYTLSFGNQSSPSLYRAMHRFADAYPDPTTGQNTAISVAEEVTFRQVYLKRKNPNVAADEGNTRQLAQIN